MKALYRLRRGIEMSPFNRQLRTSCEITSDHVTALLKTLQHLLTSREKKPTSCLALRAPPLKAPPLPPAPQLLPVTCHSCPCTLSGLSPFPGPGACCPFGLARSFPGSDTAHVLTPFRSPRRTLGLRANMPGHLAESPTLLQGSILPCPVSFFSPRHLASSSSLMTTPYVSRRAQTRTYQSTTGPCWTAPGRWRV